MPVMLEENPVTAVADSFLGGPQNRARINNNMAGAKDALLAGKPLKFKRKVRNAHRQIGQLNQRPDVQDKIRQAYNHAVVGAATHQVPEDQAKLAQADKGDSVMHGIVSTLNEARKKYQVEPEKIVLSNTDYAEIVTTGANMYSGWLPSLMDADFPSKGKIFGIDVETGPRSEVRIDPKFDFFPVPSETSLGTELEARHRVARQADGTLIAGVQVPEAIVIPIKYYPGVKYRRRLRGHIITSKTRGRLIKDVPENEMTAIETLREGISETEYRRYMKYGFILVPAESGATYQVFRTGSHTKVWKGGKLIEEVCVHLKDYKIPPTDGVIAFKTMIEIDEAEFRKSGNVYNMRKRAA